MKVRLRYMNAFRDRHGRMRYYVRLSGVRHALPDPGKGEFPSADFLEAYRSLIGEKSIQSRRSALLANGFIYVLGNEEVVKIGFTTAIDSRVQAIKAHNIASIRLQLIVPGSIRDEERLHNRFSDYRMHAEWFRREGSLQAWIDAPPVNIEALRLPCTRHQATTYLGVTLSRFDELVRSGYLPAPRLMAEKLFWSLPDLDALLDADMAPSVGMKENFVTNLSTNNEGLSK